MVFKPKALDYELSPCTGLTRESWMEAAEYLLTGIFRNIPDEDAPVVMPRKETEITYPHLDAPQERQLAERKAEMFEGLTRSFFIAAPYIQNKPDAQLCGYRLSDYYKRQILRSCTKGDPIYVGSYEELQDITGHENSFQAYQQTVETCALVICLWISRKEIWDTYTREEKDCIAGLLTSFAHANTVPQNWRLFNMLDMAFLHMEGYPIDQEIMLDHTQAILNYYVGDGWYRDGHAFDYYSCWAFNVYAPIWNEWYGYENMPQAAARFEEHSNKLMESYGDFFDRDGFTNMWGRSNIYRNAATSAFDGNMLLRHSTADPGLARRISSGSLLQFLSREDFLYEGIPTLGFYGQFSPLVQGYSCAESPFWLGKAFLCLHLPADHPFWTARENNGSWEKLKKDGVKQTVLNGPALCFTNHEANGETILRTGKVVKDREDIHGMWNYSKLCFNSKYPWESTPTPRESTPASWESTPTPGESTPTPRESTPTPRESTPTPRESTPTPGESTPTPWDGGAVGDYGGVEAQQYVLKDLTTGERMRANATFWYGEKDQVLYRRQFFNYNTEQEEHWIQAVNLADFPVANGILRVDKHRLHRRPVEFTLGAYGFPDNGTTVTRQTQGNASAIILKGKDAMGVHKQLAMTIYEGWQGIDYLTSAGTNPDSEKSIVVYAKTQFLKQYGGGEPYVMISQVLTRESHEDFTREELFPIQEIQYEDPMRNGSFGTITLVLKDKTVRKVNFEGIEGRLML